MTALKESKPWLVVTDDGRRPWHARFAVRFLADGRRIAYWWGRAEGREPYCLRVQAAYRKLFYSQFPKRGLSQSRQVVLERLRYVGELLAGERWRRIHQQAMPHPGPCDGDGWIGIAYLPPEPDCWKPDSIWPRWRHLCHAYEGTDKMESTWMRLEDMSDEGLQEMLSNNL